MVPIFFFEFSSPYSYSSAAVDRGVVGVPTVDLGDERFWGDDRLAEAAAAAAARGA